MTWSYRQLTSEMFQLITRTNAFYMLKCPPICWTIIMIIKHSFKYFFSTMSKKQEVNWLQSKAFRFQNKSPNPISHLCKIWRLLGVLTNCSQKFLALNRSLWRWLSVCERGWLAVAVCVRKGFAPSEPTSLIPAPFIILQIQTVSAYLAVQQLDIFWAEKNKTSIILDALNSKQIGIWQCCYAVSAAAAAAEAFSSDSGQA